MHPIKKRTPLEVAIFSIITCGLYLIYWYYSMYKELFLYTGKTPTGNTYGVDFFITLITCGLWGIYVDYKISQHLHEIRENHNLQGEDSSMIILILDCLSVFTFYFLWILTSAIQQDEWNQIIDQVAVSVDTSRFPSKKDFDESSSDYNPY